MHVRDIATNRPRISSFSKCHMCTNNLKPNLFIFYFGMKLISHVELSLLNII
ncbi:hypothetical protein HanRHA438_Chr08g0360821 [Helianthus annuus]|nr:hypothetical protein HanRHA438_Chr08g0360821 [Helianthus annuus]